MVNDSEPEKISLWGVLHDGELRDIKTNPSKGTADLHVISSHLGSFFGWPDDLGIKLQFEGVTESRVNQWVPDPAKGSEDIRTRRWSRREWRDLEGAIPPGALSILEASMTRHGSGGQLDLAGYEIDREGRMTDIWLEIIVNGGSVTISTPDGPIDLDRLLQIGDAYWDNVGKKRKR